MEEAAVQGLVGRRSGAGLSAWERPSCRLAVVFSALACLGLVLVASTAPPGQEGAIESALLRRLLWMAVGAAGFAIGCVVNYQRWRRHSGALAAVALALLVAVLVPGVGTCVNGARRWIRFGPLFGIQPSEFAKVALVIWLAAYCERRLHADGGLGDGGEMRTAVRGFLVPAAVAALAAGLVLIEPDFGTAVLIGTVSMGLLLVCGTRPLHVTLACAAAVPVLYKLIFGSPYRLERIATFLDPWRDPTGSGYQLVQSLIAIGSGGLMGTGLGEGAMGFLPAARNDFIMSAAAEQLGFVGAVIVIAAFLWILRDGLKVALRARDTFGFALAFGLTGLIGLQAAVHVAVVTGSVPTKGLSLPFVSAGGSALFFTMWAGGVLINVARSEEAPERFELVSCDRDVPSYEQRLRGAGRCVGSGLRRTLRKTEATP
jgi:cell division protein FtsW